MWLVESPNRILYHMEPIDIENGEYLLWDANGRAVQISVQGNTVIGMAYADGEISLEEAFKRYSETYGLNVDTKGSVEECGSLSDSISSGR